MIADDDRQNQLLEIEALDCSFRSSKIEKVSDWEDISQNIQGFLQVDFDSLTCPPIELRGMPASRQEFVCQIKFYPPIRLKFELPKNYPSTSLPKIEVFSDWMTHRQVIACEQAIERTLNDNQGMMVLYFCCQSIVDVVGSLKIEFINLNRAFVRLKDRLLPITELRDRCLKAMMDVEEEVFQNSCYTCTVCFEPCAGKHCVKFFPCEHIFCKSCVAGYYQNIAQGMIVQRMQCLSDDCDTEAFQKDVLEALGEELYNRYDEALLQRAIRDCGEETLECARESCKMISYVTDREKNLVECSYCGYSFCKNCKCTYHGVSPCKIELENLVELLNQYVDGTEEEQAEMEEIYGKSTFDELIDSKLNNEWIVNNTKPCPLCWKIDGCNKMTCSSCGGIFCWLCQKPITNGYQHFNSGPCDGRLLEGVENND